MGRLVFSLFKKLDLRRKAVQRFLSRKGCGSIPGINRLYRLMLGLHDFIYNKLKPRGIVLMDIQGSKMYVNTAQRGIVPPLLTDGVLEKYETELFKGMVKEGMVVVDIGANIGYYTLIAAGLVGKNGMVYAFEPEPSNYELLCKNIEVNGYTNVVTVQKAVSNKQGKAKLWVDKVDLAIPSFSRDNVLLFSKDNVLEEGGFLEVETTTLDEFFDDTVRNNKVDIMKMDVQGAEGLIIDGAEKVLKNNNLKIFMEFWPYALRNVGTDPPKLLYKLQGYGFKIKLINEKKQTLESVEIIQFSEKAKPGEGYNLLLEK